MFSFLQTTSPTEFWIIFALVVLFILIIFMLGSGNDPVRERIQQAKEDAETLQEFNKFRKGPYGLVDQKLKKLLDSFAEEVPICVKCRSNKFHFWLFQKGQLK